MRTQIVINNTPIDLLKEVSLKITKQLIDLQKPEKRKTDRTLTIELPGSKTNDELFNYIFEVNIDLKADDSTQLKPHFNPNKKADVIIFIDSLTQLKGYCQLKDVVVTQNNKITYKIACFGEIGDLFAKIGNAQLNELDFSEFDHTYNRGNIANSWDTEIIENSTGVPFQLGKGYIYPMIDYAYQKKYVSGTIEEIWQPNQFLPAIYVKQYIDKIFEAAGYSYTSNFLNSDFFKRLIVPFNSEKFIFTKEEIDSRLFNAGRTSSSYSSGFYYNANDPSAASPIIFNNETSPYFDNDGNYNHLTGKYTCNKAGRYGFKAEIEATLTYLDGTNEVDPTFGNYVFVYACIIHKRGSTYKQVSCGGSTATFTGTKITANDVSNSFKMFIHADNMQLQVGDELFVAAARIGGAILPASTGNLNTGWTLQTLPDNSYFTNRVEDSLIQEGDTVPLQQCVPTEIKQRDFLGSIIKAFNLYVEPNRDKANDLIIEPRADYYTGQFTDWTEKLDLSKDFTISPMAALEAGEYHFKYTDDEDYLNKTYKSRNDRTYGDNKVKIDNDFVKKTEKIELIFAPTPLYKSPQDPTTRILPYIGFFDNSNKKATKTSKIRLLYYGGMLDTETWQFAAAGFANFAFTQYPYSGHLDHPYDSTFDLGFAPPREVFYQSNGSLPIEYTNQNLYTKYWSTQIKELTDVNSKLVEGWFYLNPSDIEELSFRKYYFIKDAYYRLLKVENYDPVISKTTKCRFLKVQEFDAPLQVRTTVNGGRGTFGTNGTIFDTPTYPGTFDGGSNGTLPDTTVVTGTDNNVAGNAASVFLSGTGNLVFSGSERIAVIGGVDNTVYPLVENVTLINSSGIVATESNTLYINNQKYQTVLMGDTITIGNGDSPYTLTTATRTLFCDATEGAVSISLPSAVDINGKIFEIIKTDSSVNAITISANGSETINGAASTGLTSQYDKVKLVSNGSNWYIL